MRNEWWSCDGNGFQQLPDRATHRSVGHTVDALADQRGSTSTQSPNYPITAEPAFSRRQILIGSALTAVGWAARETSALADVTVSPKRKGAEGDVLVHVFLRGGMDGLNAVPPYAEDAYHRARPALRVGSPKDGRVDRTNRAIDLDGFFGLHPALAPIAPLFRDGHLAIVHACGSFDQSRSHFEAMATMERGQRAEPTGIASGWIARHLMATQGDNNSPLRAVAFSSVMPDSLRGATDATAVSSLSEFKLIEPDTGRRSWETGRFRRALDALHEGGKDAVTLAGRETLAVLDTLNRLDPAHYRPANGAIYPKSPMGDGLRQVACLIKGRVGLEAACLDRGGWDMHAGQNLGGWMYTELDDVGKCVSAFTRDLAADMNHVTLVLMTEFGRRLHENSALGTDHGRASAMFVIGGGIAGGKVYRRWPGLEEHQLESPGDLRVTTDYRNVLAEVVAKRLRNRDSAEVFPNLSPSFLGFAHT